MLTFLRKRSFLNNSTTMPSDSTTKSTINPYINFLKESQKNERRPLEHLRQIWRGMSAQQKQTYKVNRTLSRNPYFNFRKKFIRENPGSSHKEVGHRWKEMSDQERMPYRKMAKSAPVIRRRRRRS
ncbi:hypothetical protein PPYR_12948 [Photinus pyralis]|uniref:HMG box domain-containing protein n=1 Tax=Photinus pyralis TaxID=7054 RepID=A0A5N4A7V0_PHOPY|nr:hypothetical protein PPYR_12948 [Photinus pyralis]